MHLKKKTI